MFNIGNQNDWSQQSAGATSGFYYKGSLPNGNTYRCFLKGHSGSPGICGVVYSNLFLDVCLCMSGYARVFV